MAEGVAKSKTGFISWSKNHLKLVIIILSLILLVAIAALIYLNNRNPESNINQAADDISLANSASLKGNKNKALEYARKALAKDPSNQTAIGFVATSTPNTAESQRLYGQLLDNYIKQSAAKDPTPIDYWSEGNLAEKAGETDLAKNYYQESITTANASSNSYYQGIAQKASAELKELK